MGNMFWDRNDGLMKMPPLPIHSTITGSPLLLSYRHIINQVLVIKNVIIKKTIIHLCRLHHNNMWKMTQWNEYCGNCPKLPPMSIQHDAQDFLSNQTRWHQIPVTHQKNAPRVALALCTNRKPKPNCTFIDKDGPQIEKEWIEEFKDWVGKTTVVSPAGIPTAIKYPHIPDKTTIGRPSRRLCWFQGMHGMPLGKYEKW